MDDSASLSLGSSASGKSVEVEIRFRDSNNIEHTVDKTVEAVAGNSSFVQSGRNQTGAAASGNFARGGNSNPLGFLLGPNGRSSSATTDGIGIVPIAIGAVVVIGGGYLLYRKYVAKKSIAISLPFMKSKGKEEKAKAK